MERKNPFELRKTARHLLWTSRTLGFENREGFLKWIFGLQSYDDIYNTVSNKSYHQYNILELGQGKGLTVSELVENVYKRGLSPNIFCLDKYIKPIHLFASDDFEKDLKKYISSRVAKNFINADFKDMGKYFAPDSFDRIYSSFAFGIYAESISDFVQSITALEHVLKPGGTSRFMLLSTERVKIDQANANQEFFLRNEVERKSFRLPILSLFEKSGLKWDLHYPIGDHLVCENFLVCEVKKI